ncbi:hypothetical protein GCM10009838_50780 [Catenulispora subtropica]|uniref:Uncharacterized protein n=1 Tax=Catenulispora subtropica TaxID=450798 RepID=A0ABP5DMT5_9ACTN
MTVDFRGFADAALWARIVRTQVCIDGTCGTPESVIHTVPDVPAESLDVAPSKTAAHTLEVTLFTDSGSASTLSGSGLVFPPLPVHGCSCATWHIVYDPRRDALVHANPPPTGM